MFVPLANLVVIFVLGAKGSEWAWRNRHWNDIAHFRRVQRNWAIAGVAIWAVAALLIGSLVWFFGHSEPYRTPVAALNANPTAIEELGAPISAGFPTGDISIGGGTGRARLSFSVHGPKAEGHVVVDERLEFGHWVIERMRLRTEARGPIDLVSNPARSGPTYPKPAQTIKIPNDMR
jgi:cytochrome oxidase complex assembly protein 1